MNRKLRTCKDHLDPDEEKILSSFEKGEWTSIKGLEQEKRQARKIAGKTLRKDVRINIRLTSDDLSNTAKQP